MERCRRLGDGLAGTAGEFLPHRLDHLPLARDDLQRLGDGLAQLGKSAATAWACGWARKHDPLARQMRRQTDRAPACDAMNALDVRAARIGSGTAVASSAASASSSSSCKLHLVEQFAAAFGGGAVVVVPELGDHQLQMRHHRLGTDARASASRRAMRSAASAARRVSISSEPMSGAGVTAMMESQAPVAVHDEFDRASEKLSRQPAISGRHVRCGCRQSIPSSI